MLTQAKITSKEEMRELAEVLAIFQKLPSPERIALTYYIKGRLDAKTENIEIPLGFTKGDLVGNSVASDTIIKEVRFICN